MTPNNSSRQQAKPNVGPIPSIGEVDRPMRWPLHDPYKYSRALQRIFHKQD